MKTTEARFEYTDQARRDIDQCRKFLRRRDGSQPRERVREILNAVRYLRTHPKIHPVEGLSLLGVELRRRRAGQFVVVYCYLEPSPSEPAGLLSVRAVRHGNRADVFLGVQEACESGFRDRPSALMLE